MSEYLLSHGKSAQINPTFWMLSLRFCRLFCINLEMWSVYFTAYLCLVFSFFFFLFFFFSFFVWQWEKKQNATPQATIALPVKRILDILISSLACVYCCELVTTDRHLSNVFSCHVTSSSSGWPHRSVMIRAAVQARTCLPPGGQTELLPCNAELSPQQV